MFEKNGNFVIVSNVNTAVKINTLSSYLIVDIEKSHVNNTNYRVVVKSSRDTICSEYVSCKKAKLIQKTFLYLINNYKEVELMNDGFYKHEAENFVIHTNEIVTNKVSVDKVIVHGMTIFVNEEKLDESLIELVDFDITIQVKKLFSIESISFVNYHNNQNRLVFYVLQNRKKEAFFSQRCFSDKEIPNKLKEVTRNLIEVSSFLKEFCKC